MNVLIIILLVITAIIAIFLLVALITKKDFTLEKKSSLIYPKLKYSITLN